jgi:hypothetical protein
MVCDLEDVDPRQAAGEQDRVDLLLDIAREQEPATRRLPEEHDRDVVDARARVGRFGGHRAGIGPEDRQSCVVDRESIPCTEAANCYS